MSLALWTCCGCTIGPSARTDKELTARSVFKRAAILWEQGVPSSNLGAPTFVVVRTISGRPGATEVDHSRLRVRTETVK